MKIPEYNKDGKFGEFGGQYVAETLMSALKELETEFFKAVDDPAFQSEYAAILKDYVGRPSPLYYAKRLTEHCGGARILLKREDLNHTGAHKVNNTVGQVLLARRMGKRRLIAETGAGMHGVATATVAALFGMECEVFMGAEDVRRQAQNVGRMKMLGAKLNAVEVEHGTATLKDAMNEALRNWVATVDDTFYVIGTAAGPHPYPTMVKEFQAIIGRETKAQMLEKFGRLPAQVVACVGGGSNAIGMFAPFIEEPSVALFGAEAAGDGIETGRHAASLAAGTVGVLHGNKTYLLQDDFGQILDTHSVSAGLDYPGLETFDCRLVVVDVPLEEADEVVSVSAPKGIEFIPLAAPTSSPERIEKISKKGSGFLYYVTVAGVTGARGTLPEGIGERLAQVRRTSVLPVAAGFGISNPEMAHAAALNADAVVVGSRLVDIAFKTRLEKGEEAALDAAAEFVASLAGAMKR